MKTSPELLSNILEVLDKINQKMDVKASSKPAGDTKVKLGAATSIAYLLGKKGAAEKMAEDVEKLKKSMSGNFIKNLTTTVEKLREYNKLSKETSKSRKVSGWASAAMDIGKALLYIAGGIGAFVAVMAISAGVLGVKPLAVLGFIIGTMGALALSMIIISGAEAIGEKLSGGILGGSKSLMGFFRRSKADRGRNKSAIQNAKDMGRALMYIAGGIFAFALSMKASEAIMGASSPMGVVWQVLGVITILSMGMVALSLFTALGDKLGGKKGGKTKDAIENAKDLGKALMYIAGGIFSFALTMYVVPKLLGKTDIWGAMGVIGIIVGGIVGVMVLLSFISPFIAKGIAATKGMGIAIMVISLSILVIAGVSKILTSMFAASDIKQDGSKRSGVNKAFATIGNAAGALGVFGVFVAGLAGTMWVLGLPVISGPILLGSIALITMAWGLLRTTKAIKEVNKTMNEMGGTVGMKTTSENIRLMVSGVIESVVAGVMGKDEMTKLKDADIKIKDVRQFRRVTRIIRMLGRISGSLTQFAQGLRAFAKLGEIATLDYEYDNEGNITKPKIGEGGKVHVKTIAKNIADTFGVFISNLADNTDKLTRKEAGTLRILGKALTGERGIISGVSDFSKVLQEFAQYGEKQEAWVPLQYKNPDLKGKALTASSNIVEGTGVSVPLTKIVASIITTFGTFVSMLAKKAPEIENLGTNKMRKFNIALMGKKGRGGRETPGILDAIVAFSTVVTNYAKYGAENKIPLFDEKGEPILDKDGKQKTMSMQEVSNNMVKGITAFMDAFDTKTKDGTLQQKAKAIKTNVSSFIDIIGQFEKLANAQEGLEKLANTMGLLATNVKLLVNTTAGLDVSKLQSMAVITAHHAKATEGVTVPPVGTTGTTKPTAPVATTDWERVGEIIANKLAAKLSGIGNGEFKFNFYDENSGVVEIKRK